MGRTYLGRVRNGEAHVLVLEPAGVRPLANRGPGLGHDAAFGWGGAAQAAADLARSLLWDVLGSEPAPELLAGFIAEVLCRLPEADFELTELDVRRWLASRGVRTLSTAELTRHVQRVDGAGPDDVADLLCHCIERCWDAQTMRQ